MLIGGMIPAQPHASHRILLVDDNPHGLAVRKALLEEEGHQITTVDNPLAAIELFHRADYDLVITDYRMPEMNGIELIGRIRKTDTEVPILLISGLVGILDLQPSTTGADAVLRKDAEEGVRLKRVVGGLMHRRGPFRRRNSRLDG
jgi:two-component system, LuxR family, response regulator FixJ